MHILQAQIPHVRQIICAYSSVFKQNQANSYKIWAVVYNKSN